MRWPSTPQTHALERIGFTADYWSRGPKGQGARDGRGVPTFRPNQRVGSQGPRAAPALSSLLLAHLLRYDKRPLPAAKPRLFFATQRARRQKGYASEILRKTYHQNPSRLKGA